MDTDTKNNSKKKFNPENSDDIQKLMTESGEISANQFKVKTANSVYLFGEANEKGERSVSREGKPLKFDRCQVVFPFHRRKNANKYY